MTDDERERLSTVERHITGILVRQEKVQAQLDATAALTEAIKRDTEDIVRLIQGSRVVGKLMKWVAAIAGGLAVSKGLKWW